VHMHRLTKLYTHAHNTILYDTKRSTFCNRNNSNTKIEKQLVKFKIQDIITEARYTCLFSSLLGSTAQLSPWPPPQNPAEFLGGFSTVFFFTG
jgi:hypothetical protein